MTRGRKVAGSTMSASQLSALLAYRHADGVFVPECKMGSAGSRSLDGWALLPTWSPMTAVGYEIKVSRSDWLQDTKFEEYRACCHLFYLVAPKGVLRADELPEGVGLLEPIGDGNGLRLVMRKKPIRQEPDAAKLVRLMAHALMWKRWERAANHQTREQRAEFWRTWVAKQQDFQVVGRSVKGRMRMMLTEAIDARRIAERQAEQLAGAAEALRELGITAGWTSWDTRRRIENALRQGASETIADLDQTIERLAGLRNRLTLACDGDTPIAAQPETGVGHAYR